MNGHLFLGLDVGTQGTKGVVINAGEGPTAGRVIARASRRYGLIEGLPTGAAEQHPSTWVDAMTGVVRALLSGGDDPGRAIPAEAIAGIGISGQQHGLVAVDEDGAVVRPAKLWCDTSTADEAAELSQRLGRAVPTGYTASKVAWLARHEPLAWAMTRGVMLPHDYCNFVLTGEPRSEAGDASGTGFFDVTARAWDEAAAAAIDERLPSMLPLLVEPGAPAGQLSTRGAGLLGLRPGTLVSAGGGDNMCAALGSGATAPGVLVISLGTSGTAFTYASAPVVDPAGLIAPFCDSTGGWLPLLCVMNLTGVTEEVRAAFGTDGCGDGASGDGASGDGGLADLDALTRAAEGVPVGCDGLQWLPYLAGERVPDLPRATGTLLGMRAGHLRPGVLFRAALEGTSLNLAWGVQRLVALGLPVDEVRLVGGAAANPLWRSMLADCLDAPVRRLAEDESAALGAAIQAAWTWRRAEGEDVSAHEVAGAFVAPSDEVTAPDPGRVARYAELGVSFREQVARLWGDEAAR